MLYFLLFEDYFIRYYLFELDHPKIIFDTSIFACIIYQLVRKWGNIFANNFISYI